MLLFPSPRRFLLSARQLFYAQCRMAAQVVIAKMAEISEFAVAIGTSTVINLDSAVLCVQR